MKTISKKWMTLLPLFTLSILLFSFTSHLGGEGFEIYLNKKLLVQQYGSQLNTVKSLQLDPRSKEDELTIQYHHCGQVGKNRSITIKDAKNKILKEWHFADVTNAGTAMSCKVKDIPGLDASQGTVTLNLYYYSSELPKGRQLASLVVGSQIVARR